MKQQSDKRQSKNGSKLVPTSKPAVKTITYKLASVRDIEFQVFSFKNRFKTQLLEKNLKMSYSWTAHAVKKEKKVNFILSIGFIYENNQNKEVLVSYINETGFLIGNFDEVVAVSSQSTLNMDPNFIITCIGISISTARGILIEKLANTEYNNLILPMVAAPLLRQIFDDGVDKY